MDPATMAMLASQSGALDSVGGGPGGGGGGGGESLSYTDTTSFGGNITQSAGGNGMWIAAAVGLAAVAFIIARKK